MWFKFPDGVEQATVEQQNFKVEVDNKEGRFFRAPDHFAPIILSLPGFSRAEQPEGGPPDLPPTNSQQAGAVDQLSLSLDSLQQENELLKSTIAQLHKEKTELEILLGEKQKRIKELEETDEEEPARSAPRRSKEN